MRLVFLLLFSTTLLFYAEAQNVGNPVITQKYTADPSAHVFNDTLFVYTSHDPDTATWFDMYDWQLFSTTDMKNWTAHGAIFSLEDLSWADEYAWAPDCAEYNGSYYFYYPTDWRHIGVAVGNTPRGPFNDPLQKPLIHEETPGVLDYKELIDPAVFIDTDNTPYLYFGQNNVYMVRLNKDMISYNDTATIIKGTDHFFEAVWVHKYNGTYYISYSGKGQILYGMSDSPYGPFEYKGVVLDKVNSGTNHHSIVKYKRQWYIFYHTSDLYFDNNPDAPENSYPRRFRRSVCVDSLFYNQDGTIRKVNPSCNGVQTTK